MSKKAKRRGKRLPVVLEPAEAEALLKQPNTRCPTGLRNRAMLEVMYRAGLRVSEVCKLKPRDIRWQSGLLEVRDGKGGKDRSVPVDNETIGWLRAWQAKRPKSRWFFPTLQGKQLSPRYLQQLVKRLAHKADLERADQVTPHVLRHSYATAMLNGGFTIREVQMLLGHAALSTTMIYTHVSPRNLIEKVQNHQKEKVKDQAARLLEVLPAEVREALADILTESSRG